MEEICSELNATSRQFTAENVHSTLDDAPSVVENDHFSLPPDDGNSMNQHVDVHINVIHASSLDAINNENLSTDVSVPDPNIAPPLEVADDACTPTSPNFHATQNRLCNYELGTVLGKGSFGKVFLAKRVSAQ